VCNQVAQSSKRGPSRRAIFANSSPFVHRPTHFLQILSRLRRQVFTDGHQVVPWTKFSVNHLPDPAGHFRHLKHHDHGIMTMIKELPNEENGCRFF